MPPLRDIIIVSIIYRRIHTMADEKKQEQNKGKVETADAKDLAVFSRDKDKPNITKPKGKKEE